MDHNVPWTSVSLHLTNERAKTSEFSVLSTGQTLASAANALAAEQVNKVVIQQQDGTLILYPDGRYTLLSARAGVVSSDDRLSTIRIKM